MTGSKIDTLRTRVRTIPVTNEPIFQSPDKWFNIAEVFVDIQGDKFVYLSLPYISRSLMLYVSRFWATVVQVFPPKLITGTDVAGPSADPTNHASTSTSTSPESVLSPMSDDEPQLVHNLSGDLKIAAKEVNAKDEPARYFYKVQILEEQNEKSHEKSKTTAKDRAKWNGSLMEVQCNVMRCEALLHDIYAQVLISVIPLCPIVVVIVWRSQNPSSVVLYVTA